MTSPLRILHLEDDPTDAELVQSTLITEGIAGTVVQVNNRADFLAALGRGGFDIILADYSLPSFDGISALAIAKEMCPDIPFIFVSGALGEELAIETLKSGATDYVLKQRLSRLALSMRRALREAEERAERKRAQQALRESEETYRDLVENLNDIIYATDKDGVVTYVSPVIESLSGYRFSEVIGRSFIHFVHPDDLSQVQKGFQRTAAGHFEPREYRVMAKSGEIRWVRSSSRPIFQGDQVIGVRGVLTDITDRKQTEEALSRMQEQTSQLVGELDLDRLCQAILQAACVIVPADLAALPLLNEEGTELHYLAAQGQHADRLLGRKLAVTMPGLSAAAIRERLPMQSTDLTNDPRVPSDPMQMLGVRTGISVPLIKADHTLGALTLLRREGQFTEAEIRLLTIFANYAAGLIESAWLYEQVRQAEARYRDLYDNAPDGYYAVDAAGVIREMNAAQLSWLNYYREQVVDKMHYTALLTAEGQRKFPHLLERCRREGHLDNVELELVCKDDRLLPVRLNISVVTDAEGAYSGWRATARDITKERTLEAQLLQAQKLESLGTLVGGIAHDFNNMLTGILGFTQLLLRQGEISDDVYETLERIELLSERAADMIKQLLAFSRQDVSQKTSLSLHPFLKETGKLLERIIPENIEIELSLAPGELIVEADPTQLQQVVMNLVVNARDAMPPGGRLGIETAAVELDETFCQAHPDLQPGRYVQLSISDTGVGIAPEIRSRIFDPFFTTKEVGKGTGLGLPVVYGIVKNHGGAIEVESWVGEGTTVLVYLPVAQVGIIQTAPPSVQVWRGTETVLLVEDEPTVLELGRSALEYFGYRVLTARDGVEALEVYREHQDEIALVVLDVVMPRMGGHETLTELKRIDPRIKVLLLTGYDSAWETAEELLKQGIYGLVRKPYRIDELAQAMRTALE
jgi:PAS domain S-box-containing protein